MADFDAGSIEGRLDLDTDPFVEGLRKAKAEAANFERQRYTATVATHYTSTGDQPDTAAVKDQSASVSIGADTSDFDRDAGRVEATLERLDHEKATPEVNVDTRRSVLATNRLRDSMGRFVRSVDDAGSGSLWSRLDTRVNSVAGFYKANAAPGVPGSGHGLMALVGLAAALAPALGPATGAAVLFGSAAVAAFGGAAVSMGLYAKMATSAFKVIQDANKAGVTLSGWAGKAQAALGGLTAAWHRLQADVNPGIFQLMTQVFAGLTPWLHRLVPLINAISTGLGGAFDALGSALGSGPFEKFLALLRSNALKDLPMLGATIGHAFNGLMGFFIAINPVIQVMVGWLVRASAQFDHWANTKAPGAVTELFDTIRAYGPETLHLFSALGEFVMNLGRAFAPLTGPAIGFLITLADALSNLNLAPLAAGLGAVMVALAPFLTIISNLVNIVLPPLAVLLGTLATSFISPLADSLQSGLTPAFDSLSHILGVLAPALGEVISSFADLVNPTGVAFFAALIEGLEGPITSLIPHLATLVVALESVVDHGLEAITPAVGPATAALGGLVAALNPLLDAFSWLISHETVADTILALMAAVKAFQIVTAVATAVQLGYAAAMGITGAATALAASESLIAKTVFLAIRGATLAWTGAQWLLNAALAANPVGLIIIAIAALAVGIYEAYKHSETFRAVVDALWAGLKATAKWIAGAGVAVWHALGAAVGFVRDHLNLFLALLGPVGAGIFVVIQIVKHWSQIVNVLRNAWDSVMHFLSGVPGKVKGWFSSAGTWLINAGRSIFHGLMNGLQAVWNGEVNGWRTIGSRVKAWFSGAASWLVAAGKSIFHGLQSGLQSIWNAEVSGWSQIGSKVKGWVDGASGWLFSAGGSVISGFFSGISSYWDSHVGGVLSKIAGLKDKVAGALHINSPSKLFIPLGGAVSEGFHLGLSRVWEGLVEPYMAGATGRLRDATQNALKGVGTVDLAMAGGFSIRDTGLAAVVNDLNEQHAALTADMVTTLATSLDSLAASTQADTDHLADTLGEVLDKASDRQTTKIITTMRSNR